jgi:integrase
VKILSVAQTVRLLDSADTEMIPYFAIAAFAGLRRAEIERLNWSQVDFDSSLIELKARQAKTATRRLVAIQPNLSAWLAPYRTASGMVCPMNFRKRFDESRERAGLFHEWSENVLRHSFGSNHLAQFKDAAALALQMGNSPQVIFKHYRELVKPKDAARYWQIAPSVDASGKIVAFG